MSQDKGYYASQPPQYPQQAQPAYGQPAYGQPAYGQPAYGQPAYGQPQYPPSPAPQGYYAQPAPSPVIIQQQAPPQQNNNKDDLCFGCALGACLCCCLDGCC
ncbi:hypothetical protein MVEG_07781 [Podila verticillata NRRL 6337]|nr:hypothetical protein MVEG_07781 [Podila verticillata NRRL 6337]